MNLETKRDYEIYVQALKDTQININIELNGQIQKYNDMKEFID
jgi:hypothetical protein